MKGLMAWLWVKAGPLLIEKHVSAFDTRQLRLGQGPIKELLYYQASASSPKVVCRQAINEIHVSRRPSLCGHRARFCWSIDSWYAM
jgi:hypothetical protein